MTITGLQSSAMAKAFNLLRGDSESPEESIELAQLTRIIERATEVFHTTENALSWLQSPNSSLGGVAPLSLLNTNAGINSVLDALGRIEHGVFI